MDNWNNDRFSQSDSNNYPNNNEFWQNNRQSLMFCGDMHEQPYDPEPSYNAFREDISVAAVIQKKRPFYIKGPAPLNGEPPYEYVRRTDFERKVISHEAVKELKGSATRLSLVMLLYTLLFLVVPTALSFIFNAVGWTKTDIGNSVSSLLIYVALYPVIFSVLIYLGNIGTSHSVKSFFRKPECTPGYVFKMLVLICGVVYIVNMAYGIMMDVFGISSSMTAEPFTSVFDGVSNFIALCIFAPIFEEILFRGVFLSNHMKFGGWCGCIVSALFFALFHLNHEQMPYAFAAGLLLALVALKSGSLIPSILIHVGINFLSFLQMIAISLIDNYGDALTAENWRPEGSLPALAFYAFAMFLPYLIMLVAVIMLAAELRANKSAFTLPAGDSGLSPSEKTTAFLSSPAAVAAIIVMVLVTVVIGVMMTLI